MAYGERKEYQLLKGDIFPFAVEPNTAIGSNVST